MKASRSLLHFLENNKAGILELSTLLRYQELKVVIEKVQEKSLAKIS